MGKRGIGEDVKDKLREQFLQGRSITKSARAAFVSYHTALKYFDAWRTELPQGHKCSCGKEYKHKARCLAPGASPVAPVPKQKKSAPQKQLIIYNPSNLHTQSEWEELVVGMREPLFAYAMSQLRDRQAAEDLVSATVLKCLKSRHLFVKGTNFKAWAYTCLRHQLISNKRGGKNRGTSSLEHIELSSPTSLAVPESASQITLANEIIVKIVREIPDREICFLCWLDGKTYEEVAASQGLTVGTVKSRLWRAKDRLRRILGEITTAGDNRDDMAGETG